MELFDAHTHIHFPVYDADRAGVIQRAREAGVRMLLVGTQEETSRAGIALAEHYQKEIWATAGYHPNHVTVAEAWYHDKKEQKEATQPIFDKEVFRTLARHPKVVGIGECGLDYFRIMNNESRIKETQKKVFLAQMEIARELDKALMIHCRPSKGTDDAYEDLLTIVESSKYQGVKIVHFYVGGPEITRKLIEAGFYFTFGGVITFARDYDESIAQIPLARILLETDAPYVAPMLYRGKRNEPAYIVETAKKMAELKGVSAEEAAQVTTSNAGKVFDIQL